jgi:hypothetical protein
MMASPIRWGSDVQLPFVPIAQADLARDFLFVVLGIDGAALSGAPPGKAATAGSSRLRTLNGQVHVDEIRSASTCTTPISDTHETEFIATQLTVGKLRHRQSTCRTSGSSRCCERIPNRQLSFDHLAVLHVFRMKCLAVRQQRCRDDERIVDRYAIALG